MNLEGQDAAAALSAAWPQAVEGTGSARAQAAAALRELLEGLVPQGSIAASLQAVLALVEDGEAVLPSDLATALQLAHERLSELSLRQALAQADPQAILQRITPIMAPDAEKPAVEAPAFAPSFSPTTAPPTAPPARDWWAIPVEGLGGANQLFVLEARELLRGADLSLQALRRDPGDYAEQMVLCRSFQAVSVAAESMGLRRLAAWASEGESLFDRLLDDGRQPDGAALAYADERLGALHGELMELVGEGGTTAPVVTALQVPVPAPQHEARQPSAVEPPTETESGPESEPEAETDTETETETTANAESSPPWWWAVDWSAWPTESHPSTEPLPHSEQPAAATRTATQTRAEEEAEVAAPTAAPALRLAPAQLHAWAQRLAQWQLAPPASAEPFAALQDEIESAAQVSIDTWSMSLYRSIRRARPERGLVEPFDLEGAAVRADAELLHEFMPVLEACLVERVSLPGTLLRMRAHAAPAAVRLEVVDLGADPWVNEPAAVTPSVLNRWAAWGAAWQPVQGGWCLTVPARRVHLPVLTVQAGAATVRLPALWAQSIHSHSAEELADALSCGSMTRPDGPWPVLRLSALIRADAMPVQDSPVVYLRHGAERLALQVDEVLASGTARPIPWPSSLASWPARHGLWGAVVDSQGQTRVVTDPFALNRRFGAAARALSRPRQR